MAARSTLEGALNKNESPRLVAALAGQTKYRAARRCKDGHEPIRYTSDGTCVECQAAAVVARRKRIREALRAGREAAAKSSTEQAA